MKTVPRLQGTDGIRGPTSTEMGPPLELYLNHQRLTAGFFELYGYAYGLLLIEEQLAQPGDGVAVGWDGRDTAGLFDPLFCLGLTKAGLNVHLLGRLPTPAVPLYMLAHSLRGAGMLTASHNPADQHGIKLFLPDLGMKFLPFDDQLLTEKIYRLHNIDLKNLPVRGEQVDQSQAAKSFFISQSLQVENSWLSPDLDLSQTLLVVDCSNGAAAEVAPEIFGQLGLFDLHLCNVAGEINHQSGVADMEGPESLSPKDLQGRFTGYPFMERFFEQAQRDEVTCGQVHLVGLVFDGDADRCYRVDYDLESERGLVSSGDLLGFQLAKALPKDSQGGVFAFTVESDLNLSSAIQALGFQPQLCGVGDKWLLRQGAASMVRSQAVGGDDAMLQLSRSFLAEPNPSAVKLCRAFSAQLKQQPWKKPKHLDFALGLEESGHVLSAFWLVGLGETKVGLAGNGIKAGLNSLAAFGPLFTAAAITEPFTTGMKQTRSVYYVEQNKLKPGHAFRAQLITVLLETIQALDVEMTGEIQHFTEEPTLLFCQLKQGGKDFGALFIRNSGTENKSALYLRGPKQAGAFLIPLAEQIHLYLLRHLKAPSDPLAQLEIKLLKAIEAGKNPLELNDLGPVQRVLKEMELKQGLIKHKAGQLIVAQKGQALLYPD